MVYVFDEKNNLIEIKCKVFENGIEFSGNKGTIYFQDLKDYWYPPILFIKIIDGMVSPITFNISKKLDSVNLKMKQKDEIEDLIKKVDTKKVKPQDIKKILNQIALVKSESKLNEPDKIELNETREIAVVYFSEEPSFNLRIIIDGETKYAIVDTGANINVLKRKPKNSKFKGYVNVNGVSGSVTAELIEAVIEIQGIKTSIDATIIENIKYDALLTPKTIKDVNKKGANIKFLIQ